MALGHEGQACPPRLERNKDGGGEADNQVDRPPPFQVPNQREGYCSALFGRGFRPIIRSTHTANETSFFFFSPDPCVAIQFRDPV